jgi:hypothetical protein
MELRGERLAVSPRKPDGKQNARAERRKTSRPPASKPRTTRPPRPQRTNVSYPEITVRAAPLGRETLAAIEQEIADAAASLRDQVDTVRYEDRPRQPTGPRSLLGSSPEIITISESPIGRATRDAIEEDLAHEALAAALAPQPVRHVGAAASRIFEISIFVIEGEEIAVGAPEEVRRSFVEQRLLHRLPALSMDDVLRISISPTIALNTVIVRVWSRVGPRGR